jgi:glycosyltransferase involved in cell wall biosynthesis
MKIAISSNAPWSRTGYGTQVAQLLPRFRALGHEVAIHAWYGLEGGALNWDGAPVYPKYRHGYGVDIVGAHAANFKADMVLTLIDAWVLEAGMTGPIPFVPWFPIDMEPIPPPVLNVVKDSFQPIVYSRFGERMARNAGLDVRYVPHGIDTRTFAPRPQQEARARVGWPADKFIIGMVAANKGTPSRKSYPQQLEAFARFAARHDDALLYLHTNKGTTDGMGGVNLPELCDFLGITRRVLWVDEYPQIMGVPDSAMADLYSAMDVLLSVSMGEGFGIPIIESQSCGTPVIVGDWTSMGELGVSGWKIAKEDAEPWWTPLAAYQYLPHIGAIARALEEAHTWRYSRNEQERNFYGNLARDTGLRYDADYVARYYWRPALDEIAGRLGLALPGDGYAEALTESYAQMAEGVAA